MTVPFKILKQCFYASSLQLKIILKVPFFNKFGNIRTHSEGIAIFKQLATFTPVPSLQLFMISFQSILEFNPFNDGFNIPTINRKLIHLFVLATTQHHTLEQSERIQHTLNVYSKIPQPEIWA